MPHVPRPQRGAAVKNGFFRKDEFRYDAEQNAYICPAGQALTPIREGKLRALKKVDYGNAKACRACALRPHCTKDVRAVSRLENEDALDRMAERLKARPEILRAAPRDRRASFRQHQAMMVWTAPEGIDCARMRSLQILRQWRPPVEQISRIGMDTSKHFFQLHGVASRM